MFVLKRLGLVLLLLPLLVWSAPVADGQPAGEEDVFVRVIDVGAGLCCVIAMPDADGDKKKDFVIYDAGNYIDRGKLTFARIAEVVPLGSRIRLMVLSHSDADHLGAVDEICDAYKVERILHSGFERTTGTWRDADAAIKQEVLLDKCIDMNLKFLDFPVGATYRYGDAFMMMVSGFHKPPDSWEKLEQSEYRNAGSICFRLQYKGRSVLFCGDAVGRHIGDPDDVCIASEKFMVEMSEILPLKSDVIIAPHHGADNASSTKFIKAVQPTYVVFSAGHDYEHPRASTANRYIAAGVKVDNMFRTDRGDNEGGAEWEIGRGDKADRPGDDDVDILLRADGTVQVRYRQP
jgi:competence protein ComEC